MTSITFLADTDKLNIIFIFKADIKIVYYFCL